jgi:hypothetical protein
VGAGVNQAEGRQLAIAGLENVGSSTSHNAIGLHGLLPGYLYFLLLFVIGCGVDDIEVTNSMELSTTREIPSCLDTR